MRTLNVCFILAFNVLLANSSALAISRKMPASLKQKMRIYASNMEELLPLAFSQKNLSKEEAPKMRENVAKILEQLEGLEGHFSLQDQRVPFLGKLLNQHMKRIQKGVQNQNMDYVKWTIRSVPKLCVQCHLQDKVQVLGRKHLTGKQFPSQLDYAEYLEMMRDFKTASKIYDQILFNKTSSQDDLDKAIEGQLRLYIQVFDQPKRTISKFSSYQTFLKGKKSLLTKIDKILNSLQLYKKSKTFELEDLTDQNIFQLASKFENNFEQSKEYYRIQDSELVEAYVFLTQLYSYISGDLKNKNTPIGLYWMGVLEKKLKRSVYYSLGDLYWLSCIKEFSKHDYAKKCFQAYKEDTIRAYTGTRGIDLPQAIQEELRELEKKVGK